jgi:predicted short-subunit dehydrogenase-like oxidoreductase (DUF2520 family)
MVMAESLEPWTESPPRLDVAVVGTGKAGSVLGAALMRAGHKVVACTAVSDISRLRAESLLPGVPIKSVDDAVKSCDLVLLAVPDDVLPELVAGLAATGAVGSGTFVVHAAGRHGIDVLHPLTQSGCLPLALHPVMTFTGTSVDLNRLSGCPFGVTAPGVLRPAAEALVVEMGGEPVWVPENQRALYHAALAFGANNVMTLVNETNSLLSIVGIENPERLIAPLFGAALDNALRSGDAAVTGPIVRGDFETVRRHLMELETSSPQTVPAYKAMARLTAQRAIDAGTLLAVDAQRLLDVLAQ